MGDFTPLSPERESIIRTCADEPASYEASPLLACEHVQALLGGIEALREELAAANKERDLLTDASEQAQMIRRRDEVIRELEGRVAVTEDALRALHAAVWNRGPMVSPDPFPHDHPAMIQAREALTRVAEPTSEAAPVDDALDYSAEEIAADIAERASYEGGGSAGDPATTKEEIMDGVALIAAERARQIEAEGWTPEHDDRHNDGALASAAAFYAINDVERQEAYERDVNLWPWPDEPAKTGERQRELVKAGALIAAELDRLQRVGDPAKEETPEWATRPGPNIHSVVTVEEVEALRDRLAELETELAAAEEARSAWMMKWSHEVAARKAAEKNADTFLASANGYSAEVQRLERVVAATEDALRAAHELIREYVGGEIDPRYAAGNEKAYLDAREALTRVAAQ